MFHSSKKANINTNMNSHHDNRGMSACVQGDSGLVLTTDPKPRLRWTVELHERFVDAVTQLGGPDKATPKTIMRVMGVKGLTLYHLKSHLQKFRLGKQPHKEFSDHHSIKDGERASALELQRNSASSSGMMARSMNEMQLEVQRRLHEQLEVQRHLQLRIEAQGKYMQTILEKACQTLVGENMANSGYKTDHVSGMKEYGHHLNFPSLQDLNLYGGDQQLELQHTMERSSSLDGFLANNDPNICIGKKRPNSSYTSGGTGKSPIIWSEDLRLHELTGTAASCLGSQDHDPFKGDDDQIQIERVGDMDSAADMYERKPMAGGVSIDDKKFDASSKLERPSPRRPNLQAERLSPMIGGGMSRGTSPFG
ncbi:hypothetical protein DCAR_0310905 [Daucus carota subsp. sativus]|uniref:Uncharacterized protein n=1 Tax=Daucus carota subsp. sativus TaxID=79200 RepID=A0A166A9F1_DAUCS|nr:PREDICTED: myb family transcription factor APL-like isoform X1 [Daucus carota subsp. sativus]WOG91655.1 hypothetical protein DCAR_0310905 [Daucus carota subsp. sativus]